jgi:hypothetical protein
MRRREPRRCRGRFGSPHNDPSVKSTSARARTSQATGALMGGKLRNNPEGIK